MLTAEQEIAEIEWAAGLIPMPPHLVERGTVVHRFTQRRVLDGRALTASYDPVLTITASHTEPLVRPIVQTYVWGELVSDVR